MVSVFHLSCLLAHLQFSPERFTAECKAAGLRISTSGSEITVLTWKRLGCLLQVGREVLPQVDEYKCLSVHFTSEGRLGQETDRWTGAASLEVLSVAVRRELNQKARVSVY